MQTIRAAVCRAFGEPMTIEEVHLAPPRLGEVTVRLEAVAICHSDISYAAGDWGGALPAVYGHEAAGRVEALGEGAPAGLAIGDPVIVTLIRACGHCAPCATGVPTQCETPADPAHPLSLPDGAPLVAAMNCGAFAEAVTVHASQVARVPADMPMDAACLLSCGVITGIGAAVNAARLRAGQDVVVIGAGGVGLNAIQGARIAGARRIVAVDLSAQKGEDAMEFGATHFVRARGAPWPEVRRILGRGADAVLVTVGSISAYEQAPRYLAPSGRLIAVGMPPSGATAAVEPVILAFNGQGVIGSKMGDAVLARDIPVDDRPLVAGPAQARRADLRPLGAGGNQRRHRRHRGGRRTAQRDRARSAPRWRPGPLRLSSAEVIVTAPPPPGWGGRYWLLVKVRTACGITGWGECYAAAVGPAAMTAVIGDVFERHMAGEDPANVELMFRRAYSSGFTQRPDPTVMGAFSGLEIACWDILGKALDRPVWKLIGGRMTEAVRAYTYLYPLPHHDERGFWASPSQNAEAAAALAAEGWTAVKLDPAGPYTIRGGHQPAMGDVEKSVAMLAAIREAVGDRADILFGTHGQFTAAGAIRLGAAIEPYRPLWFEEPVPPDDVEAMAEVARAVRIPVATGERLTTRAEFAPLLARRAAAILQPALGRVGGIWEARKIAAMAESFGAQVAPHLYAGPVEWAANLHLATAIPNVLMAECIVTDFHRDLIGGAMRVEDGHVRLGDAPGLGIEVDEALARAHPYRGTGLHLQMQEAPVDPRGNLFRGGAPAGEG